MHVNSHSDEFRPTIKSEGIVPKMTFTSDTTCKFRGLPQTLRVNKFLEKLTELMKTLTLSVTVYYRERIQITISQEKRLTGQSPGEGPDMELPLSSPYQVTDMLLS